MRESEKSMQVLKVETSAYEKKAYDILIGEDLLSQSGELIRACLPSNKARKAVIATDDIVSELYASKVIASLEEADFEVGLFSFKNGEPRKSHETLLSLYGYLSEKQITRSDLIIALGGGVVGDLAGFAAASYLRGVDFVQIPTTLLAQTDSSVGGKTGVNIASGKNLVGAFHQPLLVIADLNTLKTLTRETFSDGMAEIIKHGMIYDRELFNMVSSDNYEIGEVLERSLKVKIGVVSRDVLEKGERMKLNFGHTLGHALEKHYNYEITHGSAVSIGMAMFTKASEALKLAEAGTYDKLVACLKKHNLPFENSAPIYELYKYCMNDKKRSENNISVVLCKKIGESFIEKLSAEKFAEFLERIT